MQTRQPAVALPHPAHWELATLATVAVLLTAAIYEAAVALRWIATGPAPGAGPTGGGVVLVAALLACVTGVAICLALAARRAARASPVTVLIAPSAAAFVVARFYTFDPYYLPTLRRMSDGGNFAGSWILGLALAAVAAAVLIRILPRIGLVAAATVLFVSASVGLLEGAGH